MSSHFNELKALLTAYKRDQERQEQVAKADPPSWRGLTAAAGYKAKVKPAPARWPHVTKAAKSKSPATWPLVGNLKSGPATWKRLVAEVGSIKVNPSTQGRDAVAQVVAEKEIEVRLCSEVARRLRGKI